ncbi:No child left behind, partial [Operophtera brumata]
MISLLTCNVIHKYKFKQQVNAKAHDDVTCLDWSACSKLLAVGSKDTTTKIYTVDYLDNLNMFSLSGHTDKIVGLWEASIDPDELVTSGMPDVNLIHTLNISEHRISSISISPPGDWIAFGCPNIGQLLVWEWQIWNTSNGFCFVTFDEHKSTVTDIVFSSNKKFLVSSSLDGTVRCYDLTSCVALDGSSELCAAAGQDVFDIYVWSIKFGKLLDVSAPNVRTLTPTLASSRLASASWDKTVKLWNCLETSSDCETIQLSAFTTVCYSADGSCILGGGNSKHVCLYNIKESILVRKYEITQNRSLDAVNEGSWGAALVGAVQLNELPLLQEFSLTVAHLDAEYSDRLLSTVARLLEDSRHLEHLLQWVAAALNTRRRPPPSVLLALEKVLTV